jgi:transcription initiation factor TFIID subunit 9B
MENSTTAPAVNGANDNSLEKTNPKPRDARLIHALLASQGVTAYQERVPLMLIDFAYRYTRGILSDAANLAAEGYGNTAPTSGRGANAKDEDISMTSLRLAVAARQITQFQPTVHKHDLLEMANETNKVGLPRVDREFGLRLPSERHLFTGSSYQLQEDWEDDISTEEVAQPDAQADTVMQDDEGGLLNDDDMDEDEDEFKEVMGVSQNQDQNMGGT